MIKVCDGSSSIFCSMERSRFFWFKIGKTSFLKSQMVQRKVHVLLQFHHHTYCLRSPVYANFTCSIFITGSTSLTAQSYGASANDLLLNNSNHSKLLHRRCRSGQFSSTVSKPDLCELRTSYDSKYLTVTACGTFFDVAASIASLSQRCSFRAFLLELMQTLVWKSFQTSPR